jgi:hypothetical protein
MIPHFLVLRTQILKAAITTLRMTNGDGLGGMLLGGFHSCSYSRGHDDDCADRQRDLRMSVNDQCACTTLCVEKLIVAAKRLAASIPIYSLSLPDLVVAVSSLYRTRVETLTP